MDVKVTQSCPTLCDPVDRRVHGILQARKLEWVAYPFSRGPSWPRNQTGVSCIAGGFFTSWAIREACSIHGTSFKVNVKSAHHSLLNPVHHALVKAFLTWPMKPRQERISWSPCHLPWCRFDLGCRGNHLPHARGSTHRLVAHLDYQIASLHGAFQSASLIYFFQ